MHKLYGNNIRLTRGDTLAVAVGLWNADGTEYTPNAGDVIRFALKQDYAQDTPILNIRVEKEDAAEAMYREFYERFNTEQ